MSYDIHWSEGMLLLPQHLQLFRNHLLSRVEASAFASTGVGGYGIRSLDWSLSSGTIGIVEANITLPCGTVVRVPEDCDVSPVDVAEALAAARGRLDVWIGVPTASPSRSVVVSEENPAGTYHVRRVQVADETIGLDRTKRDILVRRLNARLFVGDESRDGYSCVQLGRLEHRSDLEAEPRFSDDYVPPLLDVTADPQLQRWLRGVCNQLRTKHESLATHVASQPFAFALQTGADPEQIFKLFALNAEAGAIEQLCQTRGIHPFDTYLALCRLAGALATFSVDRGCPNFPPYDHDQIGPCFREIVQQLEEYLGGGVRQFYEREAFATGSGGGLECRVSPAGLQAGSHLYLAAVSESVTPEALDAMVGQQIKLFGLRDDAARGMVSGIRLAREVRTPAALPARHNVHYFKVDKEATPSARWAVVQATEGVQLVFAGAAPTDVQFELFTVPSP
ncbi:MAG: type VI secretion system baseplate subunit TssK [Planctomycetota bacterium]